MTFHLGSTGFSFIELSAWCPFENDSDDNDTTQWHCLQPMIWGDGTPPCYFYHVAQASQISKSALSNIRWGKKKLRSQGFQPDKVDGIIDCKAGKSHRQVAVGCCPTITKSRGQDRSFWITSQRRFLKRTELAKLQGFDDLVFPSSIPAGSRGNMVGNAMSVPLLQFVMRHALAAAQLV